MKFDDSFATTKRLCVLLVLILLCGVATLTFLSMPRPGDTAAGQPGQGASGEGTNGTDEILFSLDEEGSVFFSGSRPLKLTAPRGGTIYYTTDGSVPTPQSGQRLHRAITLKAGKDVRAYPIAAVVQYAGGQLSRVYYRTYFTGRRIAEQLPVCVLSIQAENDDLWSRERGIFYHGNRNQHGRDWERSMHVSLYDTDGAVRLDQDAGGRLYGGYSRAHAQKSMRLIARTTYDPAHGEFRDAGLFEAMYAADGTRIDSFEQLVVRNTGNDYAGAYMRDELVQMLLREQGFAFTESVRPALVYVNGTLYGLYWIHEPYKDDYFKNRYGCYDYRGEFVVLDGPERAKLPDGESHGAFDPLADYNEMYDFSMLDLTDDETYAALCARLDVGSYLQLHAAFAYTDNGDWPQNNNRVFRYIPAESEDFSDVYGMDGKWYFLPHDTDWSFRSNPKSNPLERNYNEALIQYSPLFCALMKRADCEQIYVTYFLDMMNGAFSEHHLSETIERVSGTVRAAMETVLGENGSPYLPADYTLDTFDRDVNVIRKFAAGRADAMQKHLDRKYGLGQRYTLSLHLPDGVAAQVNTLTVRGDFDGIYYSYYDTALTPIVPAGYAFDHWTVNGKDVWDEELHLGGAEIAQETVEVSLILRPDAPRLYVESVSYREGADYVVLYNPGTEAVSTLGYALTDRQDTLRRYVFPVMEIPAGGRVTVYCKNNPAGAVRGSLQTPFNLAAGEVLTLSRTSMSGEVTLREDIPLPWLRTGSRLVRDALTGEYREQ